MSTHSQDWDIQVGEDKPGKKSEVGGSKDWGGWCQRWRGRVLCACLSVCLCVCMFVWVCICICVSLCVSVCLGP